jgi:hypothetical protein
VCSSESIEFDFYRYRRQRDFTLTSRCVVPIDIDSQCLQLTQYLVNSLVPYFLAKYPEAKLMPPVLHQRFSSMLINLQFYWLFVMLRPRDEIQLNFLDLLKVRQSAGVYNSYVTACGKLHSLSCGLKPRLGSLGTSGEDQ